MRIHAADHAEVDAAWRILAAAPDDAFVPAEIHLDGHGPLYQVVRLADGSQSSAPVADQLGRTGAAP